MRLPGKSGPTDCAFRWLSTKARADTEAPFDYTRPVAAASSTRPSPPTVAPERQRLGGTRDAPVRHRDQPRTRERQRRTVPLAPEAGCGGAFPAGGAAAGGRVLAGGRRTLPVVLRGGRPIAAVRDLPGSA